MGKVFVKIKPEIAKRGGGFYDINGKQDITPVRDKDGTVNIEQVFERQGTPFVEQKIASGELILIRRESDKKTEAEKKPETEKK
jgi:hypothetical protein